MSHLDTVLHARRLLASSLLDELATAAPTGTDHTLTPINLEDNPNLLYQLGILDALATIGLVRQDDDGFGAKVVSPVAGNALRLLSDLVRTGTPLITDWHTTSVLTHTAYSCPTLTAADLLYTLERRRSTIVD